MSRSKLTHVCILLGLLVSGLPQVAGAQSASPATEAVVTRVALQVAQLAPGRSLTYSGEGFLAHEPTSVSIEDDQGGLQARLDPASVDVDGRIASTSATLPDGLALGPHTLRVAGLKSGQSARAPFVIQWQPPSVQLDEYTGKPTHTIGVSGSGFVPGEQIDVAIDRQPRVPLATISADDRGDLAQQKLTVPSMPPGDYTLVFTGRSSLSAVSVGFNVQGFHPWAVLDRYYIAPHSGVGFEGHDFVPGEVVQVFLNTRLGDPIAQVTADADGRFATSNAFALPNLTGTNQLIFVGQQSQMEVTATFAVATPTQSTPN